jgi:ferredoxin-NADP reductase
VSQNFLNPTLVSFSGPQYIKPRDWWTVNPSTGESTAINAALACESQNEETRDNQLTTEQQGHIKEAESVFVATGYRGEGENPTFGNDASHRGGTAGFLRVSEDGKRLFLPDYAGNNMYQSIGNLIKDPGMGISVPLYESGGMIQMTGTARIHWEDEAQVEAEISVSDFPGALRWIEFFIEEIVELPGGSFPVRWDSGNREMQLQVFQKIQETDDVTSFYLAPLHGDSPILQHKPGQHLTFNLPVAEESTISRSYSVSNFGQNQDYYRISVRRDQFGIGSRFLHDNVEAGDVLRVQKPAGDFIYQPSCSDCSESVIFLSAGIGVTPILSMLHAFVERVVPEDQKKAIWIHTARDGRHHAFKDEVEELIKKADGKVQSYISYTRPGPNDIGNHDFIGRVDRDVLSNIISKTDAPTLKVYMCGPSSFIGTMEDVLQEIGVPLSGIEFETF